MLSLRVVGAASLLLAGTPVLAITPLQGSIAALGIVDQAGNGDIHDNQQAISQFTAGFYTISATPAVYNLAAQATLANSFTTASWDRPDLGFVLVNVGWFSNNGGSGDATYVGALAGWSYRFQTGSRAVLQASWTYDITGAPEGINAMLISGNALTQMINSAGQISVPLAANSVYDLNVAISGEGVAPGGLDQEVTAQGLFNWSISAVPEPESWAMLISGFGLVGASLRRRRAILPRRSGQRI
jgi:hypothetical protein